MSAEPQGPDPDRDKTAEEAVAKHLATAKAAEVEAAAAHAAASQFAAAQAIASQMAEAKIAEARSAMAEAGDLNRKVPKTEPKLRHEFVGMMFALAIGEVGVQTATLVQNRDWMRFLPAYSHLTLATVVIATSWVGWTLSPAPGARQDVRSIFSRDFFVLLVDVFLVVVYFILVKTVDFTGEKDIQSNPSAVPETRWLIVIFGTYCVWDILTKVLDYIEARRRRDKERKTSGTVTAVEQPLFREWFRKYGLRIIPTVGCFLALICARPILETADPPHVLTADLALLSIVLLFRAGKGLVAAFTEPRGARTWMILCTAVCLLGFGIGTEWTRSWPMFKCVANQIEKIPSAAGGNRDEITSPAVHK